MRFIVDDGIVTPESLVLHNQKLLPISKIPQIKTPPMNPTFNFLPDIKTLLQGKQLLIDDIPFSISQIHEHYQHGYITYRKGITRVNKSLLCTRCNNSNQALFAAFTCARCHSHCSYCRKCITMGRVSECTPLLSWSGPESPFTPPRTILTWNGTLSQAQQAASDKVVEAINRNNDLLVWAV